jgi:M6 family metalloprotease-like protein
MLPDWFRKNGIVPLYHTFFCLFSTSSRQTLRCLLTPKRSLYLVLTYLLFNHLVIPESHAVTAAPIEHTLIQADGHFFQARQWGDEYLHGWETRTGYTIVFDTMTQNWVYARQGRAGAVVPSEHVVGKDPLPADISRSIRPKATTKFMLNKHESSTKHSTGQSSHKPTKSLWRGVAAQTESLLTALSPPPAGIESKPLTGEMDVLVILINFHDTDPQYTAADFNQLLFQGPKSLNAYYQEVSYNTFHLLPGTAGILGWYIAENSHDYYGDTFPASIALVEEAIRSADTVLNFADYDQDNDCQVDVPIIVIHQGEGEELSGDPTDIWSHQGTPVLLTSDACVSQPHLVLSIAGYTMMPEIALDGLTTIGVFAHEWGHALGLPDFYDVDGTSEGLGYWDVMASGSWNSVHRPGDSPAHMNPWSKYALGWLTPTLVVDRLVKEPIQPVATSPTVYQLLPGSPFSGGEYFLVENRQKIGFDVGLPGSGLAIWHIDESKNYNKIDYKNDNNTQECYFPNDCSTHHYHVALVQADNQWELERKLNRGNATDLFLGETAYFNQGTTPSSHFYDGRVNDVSVHDISTLNDVLTATLSVIPEEKEEEVEEIPATIPQDVVPTTDPEEALEETTSPSEETEPGLPHLPLTMGVTVRLAGSGSGRVISEPLGIACGNSPQSSCTYRSDQLYHCRAAEVDNRCYHRFDTATYVNLTAIAAPDSVFSGWGGACGQTGQLFLTGNKHCVAYFDKRYPLTVTQVGTGAGRVTSYHFSHQPDGIQCGQSQSHCTAYFRDDTTVILVATPSQGSYFRGWQGDCAGEWPYTKVTLKAARQCIAQFSSSP